MVAPIYNSSSLHLGAGGKGDQKFIVSFSYFSKFKISPGLHETLLEANQGKCAVLKVQALSSVCGVRTHHVAKIGLLKNQCSLTASGSYRNIS